MFQQHMRISRGAIVLLIGVVCLATVTVVVATPATSSPHAPMKSLAR